MIRERSKLLESNEKSMELDLWIPKINVALEFQGILLVTLDCF